MTEFFKDIRACGNLLVGEKYSVSHVKSALTIVKKTILHEAVHGYTCDKDVGVFGQGAQCHVSAVESAENTDGCIRVRLKSLNPSNSIFEVWHTLPANIGLRHSVLFFCERLCSM